MNEKIYLICYETVNEKGNIGVCKNFCVNRTAKY